MKNKTPRDRNKVAHEKNKPARDGGKSAGDQRPERGRTPPDRDKMPERGRMPERARKPERAGSPERTRRPEREKATSDAGIFIVEGIASVAEYLRFRPDAVKRVFATKSAMRSHGDQIKSINASSAEVLILDDRSDAESESARRSPVWAEVSVTAIDEQACLARIADRKKDLILALDHVLDPRNLGAIVRSAAFFGVREVLVSERRQALLSNASVNTAQGGFALTDLCIVVNVGRSLEQLKEQGYWIIGADMAGESIEVLRGFYDKVVLVLGAEESGLSPGVRSKCDRIVSVSGIAGGLESLNVSVAAGILLHGLGGAIRQ